MVSETLAVLRVEALTAELDQLKDLDGRRDEVGAADKSILINSTAVAVDECVVVCEEDNFYCSELKEMVCFVASCKVIHKTHANN